MRLLAQVLLTAFALFAVAASAAPTNSKFAFGIIKRTCAPWDGAAIGLTLTTEAAKCDRAPAPYLMLNLYDLPITAGKTVKIDMSSNPRGGQASLCLKNNACDPADSGEVVFVTYKEGANATGRYDLHFHNGGRVSGEFNVKWCEFREFCG